MADISVWTDGACKGNPGPAGAACILISGANGRKISKHLGEATNNVAELSAIKLAIQSLNGDSHNVTIYTDSALCIGWLSKGYKMKVDHIMILVASIKALISNKKLNVKYEKLAGHAGHAWNEEVDRMASQAADSKIEWDERFIP